MKKQQLNNRSSSTTHQQPNQKTTSPIKPKISNGAKKVVTKEDSSTFAVDDRGPEQPMSLPITQNNHPDR